MVPQLGKRRGQQRQRPRLVPSVVDQGVGQPDLEHKPSQPGRMLDGPTDLGGGQSPDQNGGVGERLREHRLVGKAGDVVGAHAEDDGAPGCRVDHLGESVEE